VQDLQLAQYLLAHRGLGVDEDDLARRPQHGSERIDKDATHLLGHGGGALLVQHLRYSTRKYRATQHAVPAT
jgi:hypothetical protein